MPSPLTANPSTGDGYVLSDNANFTTARDAATGTVQTSINGSYAAALKGAPNYFVVRAFMAFDTSAIPDTATVTAVTLGLTSRSIAGTGHIADVVTTSNTSLTEAAYAMANWGTSALASFSASWTVNTLETQTVTGLTINKEGSTYIGMRGRGDVSNSAPGGNNLVTFYSSRETTASRRPVLTVTYTEASTVPLHLLRTNYYPPFI